MSTEKAKSNQLKAIFHIFTDCRKAMEKEGIFQWTEHYPSLAILTSDIDQGYLFCLTQHDAILGVINISAIQEPEYAAIRWARDEARTLVIHRLAIQPYYQKQGLARKLMDFAEDYAIAHSYLSMRLDAYSGNERVLRFYENRGYEKRGEVFFPNRNLPFYCYEKQLGNTAENIAIGNTR